MPGADSLLYHLQLSLIVDRLLGVQEIGDAINLALLVTHSAKDRLHALCFTRRIIISDRGSCAEHDLNERGLTLVPEGAVLSGLVQTRPIHTLCLRFRFNDSVMMNRTNGLHFSQVRLANHLTQLVISEADVAAPVLADEPVDFQRVIRPIKFINPPNSARFDLIHVS